MYAKVSMKALNSPIPMNVTAAAAEKVLEFDNRLLFFTRNRGTCAGICRYV
jgi:hypothetical protein